MDKRVLMLFLLLVTILVTACSKLDVTFAVKQLPEVKEFLKENPNAEVRAVFWGADTITANADLIQKDCSFKITSNSIWRVTVKEESISMVVYLDGETRQPICIFKEGQEVKPEEKSQEAKKEVVEVKEEGIVCEKPYIRHGTDCCLDKNDNKICDKDETEAKEEETVKTIVKNEAVEVNEDVGEEQEKAETKPTTTETDKTNAYLPEPYKGEVNAPVVVEEFSDFQCPFCGRFFSQTLPQIETEYIGTGKVKFIYRDYPLEAIHPQALIASLASACAQEQNKFWDMHDRIYSNQNDLSVSTLKEYAKDMGLDTSKFNECLDSRIYEAEIKNDILEGTNKGVRGTPTFYINGKELVGAQPFDAFKDMIDKELGENKAGQGDTFTINLAQRKADTLVAEVSKGTTVTWVNNDGIGHVIAIEGLNTELKLINPGETYGFRFNEEGEYVWFSQTNTQTKGYIYVK